jgi:hypothetical protein
MIMIMIMVVVVVVMISIFSSIITSAVRKSLQCREESS